MTPLEQARDLAQQIAEFVGKHGSEDTATFLLIQAQQSLAALSAQEVPADLLRLEALADAYAKAAATAHVEDLYGGSKAYTQECIGKANKARSELMRALTAAPAAPKQDWRPIETAPKDGSEFLCWVSAVRYGETDEGQQYQQDVSQASFCNWRTQPGIPDCGWFDPCCGQIADQQAVTHWLPLPSAPAAPRG